MALILCGVNIDLRLSQLEYSFNTDIINGSMNIINANKSLSLDLYQTRTLDNLYVSIISLLHVFS